MKLAALIALLALGMCGAPARSETIWRTAPYGEKCRDIESGNADEGQDFIFRRCTGMGATGIWILYQEGRRMSVGFGSQPHHALAGLNTERGDSWPVQWGGEQAGGGFTPRVAIVRFRKLGEETSTLFVFRLLENGASCVVGEAKAGAGQNNKAKAIAGKAMRSWTCLSEPVPVTS